MSIRGMAWGRGSPSLWKEDGQQVSELPAVLPLGSVPGQPLCKLLEVDATMVVQDTWTPHQKALNCKTVDINTYVRYESGVREHLCERVAHGQPVALVAVGHLGAVGH